MKYKKIIIAIAGIMLFSCQSQKREIDSSLNYEKGLTKYVNPFIGTSEHGHVSPAACLPFGMVQLGPDTGIEGWDWSAGYHTSDSSIMGFSHNRLSGTGPGGMGDILIMPFTGELKFEPGTKENPDDGYRSRFSHKTEVAGPGFYAVELADYEVYAEMTTSYRVGFHRYSFHGQDSISGLIIDLGHGIDNKTVKSSLKFIDDHTIVGYRSSTCNFVKDQLVYFCAEFSEPIKHIVSFTDGIKGEQKSINGAISKMGISFNMKQGDKLLVKVGLSSVNEEGAQNNLEKEIPDWDFDRVKEEATQIWEKELSRLEVTAEDNEQKTIFYTALYHSLVCPNLISDVDGSYRGWDKQIHHDANQDYYTTFSLWDTYRALHPLFSLVYPDKNRDFINSMMEFLNQTGLLPIMVFGLNEKNAMIGYHSVPVISQAILEDQTEFDYEKAFTGMKTLAMRDNVGLKYYKELGYIPSENERNSVSKVLEYAFDDWCIAQVAKKLGKNEDYQYFIKRAKNYRNHFDSDTRFMRGRHKGGQWREPFDPKTYPNAYPNAKESDFIEANSWQYTFYVPQDISGLIGLLGGEEAFITKLDSLFTNETGNDKINVLDVTGLIGQYGQGNEPSHHIAYLYNFAGMPWKTQEMVHKIKNTLYNSGRDGLCGNDDCGQMSAWYVFSSLGFYPVTPGIGYYVIGTPSFSEVKLHLQNGKSLSIKARENSDENFYIQKMKLNKEIYSKSFITTKDLREGGIIEFFMGNLPQKEWGSKEEERPISRILD